MDEKEVDDVDLLQHPVLLNFECIMDDNGSYHTDSHIDDGVTAQQMLDCIVILMYIIRDKSGINVVHTMLDHLSEEYRNKYQ